MMGAFKPYLLPASYIRKLRAANDSRGVWVGMLPFSRLPFLSSLIGLLVLAPLVLIDSGFSLYWAQRDEAAAASAPSPMQLRIDGINLDVPPSLERIAVRQKGAISFPLERIGRHLVPLSRNRDEFSPTRQVLRLSSAKARPGVRTVIHSITALHQPVPVETTDAGLEVFQLAAGPITKAHEMVLSVETGAGAPFMALCGDGAEGGAQGCTGYVEAGSLFIEVDFSAASLEEWRLIEASARSFAALLTGQK